MTETKDIRCDTLDELIKKSGMTKQHVSKEMGITYSRLWQLLKSPKGMSGERIELLAKIIGVTVDEVWSAIRLP